MTGDKTSDTVIWSEDGLTVWTRPKDGGGFTNPRGHDLRPTAPGGHEYEHAVTVAECDVPALVAALARTPGTDALELVAANTETIARAGELTWQRHHGVEPDFWSRIT